MNELPPLDLTYAAVFGTAPDPVIAKTLERIDRYLRGNVTPSTALMLCILLRPLDLYEQAVNDAARQLSDTRLVHEMEMRAFQSQQSVALAKLNAAIDRLTQESDLLNRRNGAVTAMGRSRAMTIGQFLTCLTVSTATSALMVAAARWI